MAEAAQWSNTPCPHIDRRFDLQDWYDYDGMENEDVELGMGGFTFADCDCYGPCDCFANLKDIGQPLVIASDGGCRHHLTPNAIAAVGVYVGEGSPYNVSELLPRDSNFPTSQRAELTAALFALKRAITIVEGRVLENIDTVILKCDCTSITDGLCDHVFNWRQNGYMTRYKHPVLHRDLFWQIEEAVTKLYLQYGVHTLFWWVPRKHNKHADSLASLALQAEEARLRALGVDMTLQATIEASRSLKKRKRGGDEYDDIPQATKHTCFTPVNQVIQAAAPAVALPASTSAQNAAPAHIPTTPHYLTPAPAVPPPPMVWPTFPYVPYQQPPAYITQPPTEYPPTFTFTYAPPPQPSFYLPPPIAAPMQWIQWAYSGLRWF